jgi:hypothetical protein
MARLARKRQAAAYRGRRTNSRAGARRLFAELRRGEASLYYVCGIIERAASQSMLLWLHVAAYPFLRNIH